ncbi:MAG: DUF4249 domain-containing protein [Paramuribaculum sp.]|nr:DUF4249 domain-containing protein [Paramuribaculum sp.]
MGILKKLSLFLIPLFLTGCYEDFSPEIDTKPILCINSLITAGESIEVSVTRTWLYTDLNASQNHQVNDAAVSIYVNGEKKGADYLPQEGDCVKIMAESAIYGKAEAEVKVPVSVPIESLAWKATGVSIYSSSDMFGGESEDIDRYNMSFNINVALTIKDPASTKNYYKFSYQGYPEITESDPNTDGMYIDPDMTFTVGTFNC